MARSRKRKAMAVAAGRMPPTPGSGRRTSSRHAQTNRRTAQALRGDVVEVIIRGRLEGSTDGTFHVRAPGARWANLIDPASPAVVSIQIVSERD